MFIIFYTKSIDELQWAYHLARMTQASFVAYGVGGAFLGLAYFDLLYHLFAIPVILRAIVTRDISKDWERKQQKNEAARPQVGEKDFSHNVGTV